MRASAILAPTTLGLLATTALAQTVTNGPGDDTAALQAAIDNATPGSTIQLLAGEYTIGGVGERVLDLRGKAGIMIVGAGAGQTTVRFTGTGDAATADLFDLSGATDLSFADFTLSGGGRTDVDNGFVGFGGSGHTWSNLAITDIAPAGTARTRGFVGAGIFTGGVDDVSITNSTFRNVGNDAQFGAAVRIEDGIGATVADNAITNTGRNGIILKQTSAGTITNNDIRGTGLFRNFANANNIPVDNDANGVFNLDGLAIELFSESADANGNLPASLNFDHVVQGNTVDHWISIDRGSNIAVRDNIIDGRGSTLVQLIGLEMAGAGENVIFADNVVRQADPAAGNQYSGLSISNSGPKNNVLVAGNTFDNLEEFGMQLQGNDANDGTGELRRIVVARNTVQNTQREIGGTAANGDFALGDATSDGTGIRMLNAVFDATFIDNIVTNNGNRGVVIGNVPSAADELAFVDNQIQFNGEAVDLVINFGDAVDASSPGALYFDSNDIDGYTNGEPDPTATGFAPIVISPVGDQTVLPGEALTIALGLDDPQQFSYLWDVGEGLPLTDAVITHTFLESQIVNVAVWDANGVGGYLSFSVTVVPEPLSTSGALGFAALVLRRRR